MAQICVVNCYSCKTFQGQQVSKGKKWTCKMCGEKQAFTQIFAQGSGKECRLAVQKLNMFRGNVERKILNEVTHQLHRNETTGNNVDAKEKRSQTSKWNQFVASPPPQSETETIHKNSIESSCTTERAPFNKYRGVKHRNTIEEKKSEDQSAPPQSKIKRLDFETTCVNIEENSQTKAETISKNPLEDSCTTERNAFDFHKTQYPRKCCETHLGDIGDEHGNTSSQTLWPLEKQHQRLISNEKAWQKQPQKWTVVQAPKVSKWSKYM